VVGVRDPAAAAVEERGLHLVGRAAFGPLLVQVILGPKLRFLKHFRQKLCGEKKLAFFGSKYCYFLTQNIDQNIDPPEMSMFRSIKIMPFLQIGHRMCFNGRENFHRVF
jgi:hypothetical protein